MEHKNDINKKTVNHSVITEHRLEFNHDFDWDNSTILDIEKLYYGRLISEMINIKTHSSTINLQSDTEPLQHSYCESFNRKNKEIEDYTTIKKTYICLMLIFMYFCLTLLCSYF